MDYSIFAILILNSLYIFGFANATEYGLDVDKRPDKNDREVLWFIRWGLRNAPNWLQKPLFACVVCMSSVHGWVYLVFNPELTIANSITYIIYIFALSGFNKLVNDNLS